MAALYDPPRPDSAKLIEELRSLSISTKMLTGDAFVGFEYTTCWCG